jgi:formate/nitrite transporter
MFAPSEIMANYAEIGAKKASQPAWKQFLLGALSGFLIGMGAAVSNTAAHAISNVSAARVVSGLLFPFGLGMVMITGSELFTGNWMIPSSALERKISFGSVLKNWFFVYIGNFAGAALLALACAYSGQFNYSGGGLAVYAIKSAAAKCALPFSNALILGILCNLLVCTAVLCALSAKDAAGKILGAFIPVAFFVICGFEHSIANMYYAPAGIFAANIPAYAALAAEAGVDVSALTWGNFLLKNLAPVTIGNILGGLSLGLIMWLSWPADLKKSARDGAKGDRL